MIRFSPFATIVGLFVCASLLTAGPMSSSCVVQQPGFPFPPPLYSASPCLGMFQVTVPPFDSGVSGFISGTDQTGGIDLRAGVSVLDRGTFLLNGQTSYGAGTTYIVPGSGIGTLQATIYAGAFGFTTERPNQIIDNSQFSFALGSSSYNCQPRFNPAGCGIVIGQHIVEIGGVAGTFPMLPVLDFVQTGTFTLGEPFGVGFSFSDFISVDRGEMAGQRAAAGITSLHFFDASGNPLTPAEAGQVPEPATWMLTVAGIGLYILRRRR